MMDWIRTNKAKAITLATTLLAGLAAGTLTWADAWTALGQLVGVGG